MNKIEYEDKVEEILTEDILEKLDMREKLSCVSPTPYQFGIYITISSPFLVSSPFNSWYYKLIEWKYFKQLKLMMFGIKCPNLRKKLAFTS